MATDVSGRGIGLDAVAALFRSIGGDLWIRSVPGEGSRVTVEVPVARRGERVLVVRVGSLVLALPSAAVRSFSRLRTSDLTVADGRTIVRRGSSVVSAVSLAALFSEPETDHATMVEITVGGRITAVIVDSILDEEEIFIRPLPAVAGAHPSIQGIAVLSTGNPVAVLSLQRLGPLEIGHQASPEAFRDIGVRGRILLTDDTVATRKMLHRLLEDAGYQVTGVESAEEALRLIDNEPFDCVITGVELPGLSGIDLTRRVRSSDLYSDLPVVVLSTRDRPADRLEGLEAGADAYLTKQGMEPAHLLALIRRITSEGSGS
jgi:CheY-like chemotaxis protein